MSTQHAIVGSATHNIIVATKAVEKSLAALERSIETLIMEQSHIRGLAEEILRAGDVEAVQSNQMWSHLGAYDRVSQQLFARQQNGVERAIELQAHMLTLLSYADDLHKTYVAISHFVDITPKSVLEGLNVE